MFTRHGKPQNGKICSTWTRRSLKKSPAGGLEYKEFSPTFSATLMKWSSSNTEESLASPSLDILHALSSQVHELYRSFMWVPRILRINNAADPITHRRLYTTRCVWYPKQNFYSGVARDPGRKPKSPCRCISRSFCIVQQFRIWLLQMITTGIFLSVNQGRARYVAQLLRTNEIK